MVPMALPTLGGIALSLVTLLTVPVLFSIRRRFDCGDRAGQRRREVAAPLSGRR